MELHRLSPTDQHAGTNLNYFFAIPNQLRSMLREFYPAALAAFDDLAGRDALAVLAAASTPAAGRALSIEAIIELLRQAERRRYLTTTAAKIYQALQAKYLQALPQIAEAYGASTGALVSILIEMCRQITTVEDQVVTHFSLDPRVSRTPRGVDVGASGGGAA
jgi:hypothetical protein